MKERIHNFINEVKQQANHIAFFCILFAVGGYYLPRIWFQYFDQTQYYKVESPAKIEQRVYKPCENTKVFLNREALIDLRANATINLSLKTADGKEKYGIARREVVVTKGKQPITTYWPIKDINGGCNLPDGTYFYDAVVEYQIQGVTKQTFFSTELFQVKN